MNKNDFDTIKNNLQSRIDICEANLGNIDTTEDLESLPVSTLRKLRSFCEEELNIMDKVAQVELYHILGMGNLSAIQTSTFIGLMKKYLEYRPLLKSLVFSYTTLYDIPELPRKTSYKCTVLGITLLSGAGDTIVDDVPVNTNKLPYIIEDNKIKVPLERLREFYDMRGEFGCQLGKLEDLRNAIYTHNSYWGISWESHSDGIAVGLLSSQNVREKAKKIYSENT